MGLPICLHNCSSISLLFLRKFSTNLETIIPKNETELAPKMERYILIWEGIPKFETWTTKWYDDVFDEWYQLIILKLNDAIDKKKINIKKRRLPVHYMNYLYLLHRNRRKEITDENIISEIIQDMNLPMKNIIK